MCKKVQEGSKRFMKVQKGSWTFKKVQKDSRRYKMVQEGSRKYNKNYEGSKAFPPTHLPWWNSQHFGMYLRNQKKIQFMIFNHVFLGDTPTHPHNMK